LLTWFLLLDRHSGLAATLPSAPLEPTHLWEITFKPCLVHCYHPCLLCLCSNSRLDKLCAMPFLPSSLCSLRFVFLLRSTFLPLGRPKRILPTPHRRPCFFSPRQASPPPFRPTPTRLSSPCGGRYLPSPETLKGG